MHLSRFKIDYGTKGESITSALSNSTVGALARSCIASEKLDISDIHGSKNVPFVSFILFYFFINYVNCFLWIKQRCVFHVVFRWLYLFPRRVFVCVSPCIHSHLIVLC